MSPAFPSLPAPRLSLIERAADLGFIREVGKNNGPGVRMCQAVTGNKPPDAWCASFVSLVLYCHTRAKPPFALSAGCDELLRAAAAGGRERERPVAPGLFFVMQSPTDAVHVGFVEDVNLTSRVFSTIEGNASDPTKPPTREGWGVFSRARAEKPGAYRYISLEDL